VPAVDDDYGSWQERYERLREDALSAAGQGWRWGRALLQRRGVAAWMAAGSVPEPVGERVGPQARSSGSAAAGDALVAALAALVLACAEAAEGAGCGA
jgi:hypothetical protein